MSRTPYFFVERYDKYTEKYELQHPIVWNYNHTEQERADLFPYNGSYDIFSIVEGADMFPRMNGIHTGLPNNSCEEIIKAFDNCCYEYSDGERDSLYSPNVKWFTYADMYIYYLQHPNTIDYEAMDETYLDAKEGEEVKPIMHENPIALLKKWIDAFLEVTDGWNWSDDYSLIRIVFWIM